MFDKIILCVCMPLAEVKAVSGISDDFIAPAINYLNVSINKLAIIVNFGEAKFKHKRVVLSWREYPALKYIHITSGRDHELILVSLKLLFIIILMNSWLKTFNIFRAPASRSFSEGWFVAIRRLWKLRKRGVDWYPIGKSFIISGNKRNIQTLKTFWTALINFQLEMLCRFVFQHHLDLIQFQQCLHRRYGIDIDLSKDLFYHFEPGIGFEQS